MKKTILMSAFLLNSFNAFPGTFSTDVAIKSNLIITNSSKELIVDNSGATKLNQSYTEAEFDYQPGFGRGDLIIKQGPSIVKLKVPRDRYHNEGEFTLYSVDSGLIYDIYMRRSAAKIVNTMTIKEDAPCTYLKYKGVASNGAIINESHPGTQKVLNRYDKINRDYLLSFVRDQKSEGSLKQTLESMSKTRVQALNGCLPNDMNVLFR